MKIVNAEETATYKVEGGEVVRSQLTERQIIELALKQYTNPVYSGLREAAATNPADACVRAGRLDEYIDVHIAPTDDKKGCVVTIRDYGCGMSGEFLSNNYFALGNTTARDDAALSGGYGLGSKALLAVADMIAVRTIQNGMVHSVIGQLIEDQIVVGPLSSDKTDERDGTELTIMLPNHTVNAVKQELRLIASFIGTGSSFVGQMRLGVSEVPGHKMDQDSLKRCWPVRVNQGRSSVDYYSNSVLILQKSTSTYGSERTISVGGERAIIAVPEDVGRQLRSGVIWNNAIYTVPTELVKMVDIELVSRGIRLDTNKILATNGYRVCFVVFPSDSELAITSDRSFLKVDELNAKAIADRLEKSQQELGSKFASEIDDVLAGVNAEGKCLQSEFDKLIVKAKVYLGLFDFFALKFVTTQPEFASIALPLRNWSNPQLDHMCSYNDLVFYLSYVIHFECSSPVTGAIQYCNRDYGTLGWKNNTQYNSTSTHVQDKHGKAKESVYYRQSDRREVFTKGGITIPRVVVVAARGDKGSKQSLSALKKPVFSVYKECAFPVIYVPGADVERMRDVLQQRLNSFKLKLKVMTISEFAESLGHSGVVDRSTIAASSRFLKDQNFIYDFSVSKRTRLDDLPRDVATSLIEDNTEAGYPGKTVAVYPMFSNGEVMIDDEGAETTVQLGVMTEVLRSFGIALVGVGKDAGSLPINADVTILTRQMLLERIWRQVRLVRYMKFIRSARMLMKNCSIYDIETRKNMTAPPPYTAELNGLLPCVMRRVLGPEFDMRELTEWGVIKKGLRRLPRSAYQILDERYTALQTVWNGDRSHRDNAKSKDQCYKALRLLLGDEFSRFISRYISDSLTVRRMDMLKDVVREYLGETCTRATAASYQWSAMSNATQFRDDRWHSSSQYMGDSLQLAFVKRSLRELWKMMKAVK